MVTYLPERHLYFLHVTNSLERHITFLNMAFQDSEELVDEDIRMGNSLCLLLTHEHSPTPSIYNCSFGNSRAKMPSELPKTQEIPFPL